MDTLLWVLAVVFVLAGIAGTVLPALPGTPLVFLGLLLGAWIDQFEKVGGWTLTILAVLTILSFMADLIAVAYGARRVDASRQALAGALIGTVIGLFTGLMGLMIGPFLGAAIGEWAAKGDLVRAGKVGVVSGVALIFGTAAKLTLTFLMVGLFVISYLWK